MNQSPVLKLLYYTGLLATLVFFGCEGARGPDGESAQGVDHIPPEVTLVSPLPDSTLYVDQITFEAQAYDEGGEVDYVAFYVNGTHRIGDDSAVVFFPPYRYDYDFSITGAPLGLTSLTIMAFDTSGNSAQTPTILYQRRRLEGLDTLSTFHLTGQLGAWPVPEAFLGETDLDTVEYFNYAATRFTTIWDCQLVGFEFYIQSEESYPNDATNYIHPSGFWTVFSYPESQGGHPGTGVDSVLTDSLDVVFEPQWTYVDLSLMNGDTSAYSLEAGEEFFLGVKSTSIWWHNLVSGLYLAYRIDLRSGINTDPATDPSWWYLDASESDDFDPIGWSTLREYMIFYEDNNEKQDWLMRAIVDYGDGGLSAISPDGSVENLGSEYLKKRK